jgi:hypothetical protein
VKLEPATLVTAWMNRPATLVCRVARMKLAANGLIGQRQRFLPPEPFRYIGARAIRVALIRQDDVLDAGREPGALVSMVASLPGLLGYRFKH